MTSQVTIDSLLPELATLPGVLTLPQVAVLLQLSRTAAYNLAATGELPALRFGGSVRVLKTDLAAMIMRRSVSAETAAAAGGEE
jgi:excisionase family DNA binding protein